MPRNKAKNLLIIRLESSKKKPENLRKHTKAESGAVLKLSLGLLKWFGYQVSTLKDAMAADSGNFVCVTVDSENPNEISPMIVKLEKMKIPGTIFVPTSRIRPEEVLGSEISGSQSQSQSTESDKNISWQRLRQLYQTGWEIGALSHDPSKLTQKPQSEQEFQIEKSSALLEENIGMKPVSFSYPAGAYDSASVKILKENGYKNGVSLDPGMNRAPKENSLRLNRICIDPSQIRSLTSIILLALERPKAYNRAS